MDQKEIIYHVSAWAIGTIGGCLRAGRDGDYHGFVHLLCVGAVAGMLSFCIVGIGNFYSNGWGITGWAVAAGVGSMGREIVDMLFVDVASALRKKIKSIFGSKEESDDKEDKDTE